ncbi:type II secretion system protein [Roseibacillus ishigakijimensis]|uniref:Prepilin-type N-terminal cleavage/methylation domain-containing protein n=1 Tax=Roseibacillus ishigakijimensis TaxID=454146 RepID=A0A934RRC0_9BACT|nr:prepilin-type N-terminal cleavage/methylation domain-containing protein [Roseibacillus ishigakijimensis]MBK1835493.1 prepilin-type N-terminal cleavage/methylation domain-containing protein [Roseibacillus ishigakijimensis]
MKATKGQMRSGFTLVELLVVISIIVVLAGLAVPTAMKALAKAEQVTGINNVKGIKSALDLFASDFDGEYPSDSTAEEIMEISDDNVGGSSSRGGASRLNPSRGLDSSHDLGARGSRGGRGGASSDKPSNYYFTQLMGHGLDNEELFYLKSFKKAFILKKPNNDKQIDQGENVWGYTKNLQQTSSSHIPIVFDSPISTGDSPKFSKKVWDGKIIVAKLDSSTRTEMIAGSDKASGPVTGRVDGDRMNLFSQEALEEGQLTVADLKRLGGN